MGFAAWVVIVLAASAVLAYFQRKSRRRRSAAVAALAGRIGFTYARDDTSGLVGMPFWLFGQGHGQHAREVISGTRDGLPLSIFDFEYWEQGGRSRDYHYFTCAVLTIAAACPDLRLTHETALTRLEEHLGHHDVELEYDDFNRQFRVTCEHQKFAFSLLDAQMMRWLMATDAFQYLEIAGSWVLLAGPRLKPPYWLNLGNWLDEFQKRIPPVVYSTFPRQ